MPINISIPDTELTGFSDQAQSKLEDTTKSYASDLISEANRLEAGRSASDGNPEVTAGMVENAAVLLRHGYGRPRKALGVKVIRALSAIFALIVGMMYDQEALQDRLYMGIFLFSVAITILFVIISIMQE